MDELDTAIAGRLQATLKTKAMSREDMALAMTRLGFQWTRNTVTQVIIGRRSLSLLELAGACTVLGLPIDRLLDCSAHLALPAGGEVLVADVLLGLLKGEGRWLETLAKHSQITAAQEEIDRMRTEETTHKAALSLGVDPATVEAAAQKLWGRSLRSEREARIDLPDTAHSDVPATSRTMQAIRGHTTRALISELRAYLTEQP